MIKVCYQVSDKLNKSIYWFYLNVVKDRVNGNECFDNELLRKV